MTKDREKGNTLEDLSVWEQYCNSQDLEFTKKGENSFGPIQQLFKESECKQTVNPRSKKHDLNALDQADLDDWEAFQQGKFNPEINSGTDNKSRKKPSIKRTLPHSKGSSTNKGHTEQYQKHSLDPKVLRKLNKGECKPEAVLDLHGLIQEEASKSVSNFVNLSYAQGKRLILIITGKGLHSKESPNQGILNKFIPKFLQDRRFSSKVLHVQPAHSRHGGNGAYYCYLRK